MVESISVQYVQLFQTVYDLTNYLAEILSAISQLDCVFSSSKLFVRTCRKEVRDCYMMVSFDIEPLFSNIPFIRIIVTYSEKIHERNEITTSTNKIEMN